MPRAKLVVVGEDFLVVTFFGIVLALENLVIVIVATSEVW